MYVSKAYAAINAKFSSYAIVGSDYNLLAWLELGAAVDVEAEEELVVYLSSQQRSLPLLFQQMLSKSET